MVSQVDIVLLQGITQPEEPSQLVSSLEREGETERERERERPPHTVLEVERVFSTLLGLTGRFGLNARTEQEVATYWPLHDDCKTSCCHKLNSC